MNARRDSAEPEAGALAGRVLLVGSVVFAAAATGLLVLTDQEKWLRLGIVAALWAALTGAFLAARYRRQLNDQRAVAEERQEIYELELEREIAARREHELEVEAAAKRRAEESSRDDIAALRTELANMQQTLESLLGGEFLVERYALRAESTRMRSLPEERSLAMRHDVKHLPAAVVKPGGVIVPPVLREAETELIERIREVHQVPRREQPSQRGGDSRPPSAPRGTERPKRVERPTPEPAKHSAQLDPPTRQEPQLPPAARQARTRGTEHPAELSDRWFVPEGLGGTAQPPARSAEQPRRQEQRPADQHRRPAPGWETGPAWESRPAMPPVPSQAAQSRPAMPPVPPPAARSRPAMPPVPPPAARSRPAMPPVSSPAVRSRPAMPAVANPEAAYGASQAEQASWLAQYNKPTPPEPTYSSRAYVPPARPEPPRPPEPVLTDRPSRRNTEFGGEDPTHHRHRADPAEESGGGRRRRADGQPSWQETVARREEASGSHASGRSVSELLANHGLDESSPRRRRRRED